MSASKSTSTTNVTSDEAAAAKNLASFSSSTLSMSSVKKQFLEGFGDDIGPKNDVVISESTNNPPEPTVVAKATSNIAVEEMQVLEDGPKKLDVKCSRIFNWRTPNAKQCEKWAVEGGRARKAKYCFDCALELKKRDNARKRRERKPAYEKKRKVKHEKGEEKTGCEEKTGGEEKNEEIEVIPQEGNQKIEKLEITPPQKLNW